MLFSPPYKTAHEGGGLNKNPPKTFRGVLKNHSFKLSDNPNNIDNLPFHAADCVVTSPPYGEAHQSKNLGLADGNRKDLRPYSWLKTNNPAQIDNLPFNADYIVTSPPYEGSLEGTTRHTKGGIASRDPALAQTGTYATRLSFGVPVGYSPKEENIGNLKSSEEEYEALADGNKKDKKKDKSETYLEAMKTVYAQCYKILKPQGKLIIIIKDFIRHFQVVKLHEYTRQLCESCGFKLEEVLLFRLPQQSFWRILYRKKHGHKVKDLDMLDYEWILIFEKEQIYLKEKR